MSNSTDLLKKAIKKQLLDMINEGVDVKTLSKIERFCSNQKGALLVVENPNALLRKQGKYTINSIGTMSDYDEDSDLVGENSPVMQAAPGETYGVKVLRELMGPLQQALQRQISPPEREPSITELVHAISSAQMGGLGEDVLGPLRDQLKLRLGSSVPLPPAAAEAPLIRMPSDPALRSAEAAE